MIEVSQSINDKDKLIVEGLTTNSRLQMFNVIKDDTSEYYFNIFKNYSIPEYILDDTTMYDTYIVDNADWWDNISAHWYDTSELWWLICWTNEIVNPYEDIYVGQIIKIFKREYYGRIVAEMKEIYNL